MQLILNSTSPFARIARIALEEAGFEPRLVFVDPWEDPPALRATNPACRVPTLMLDDGSVLTECLLIITWLEWNAPAAGRPGLLGGDVTGVLSRAGLAMGALEAAVHTLVGRKITAPLTFDEAPVGLRRRRTMVESLERLEAVASQLRAPAEGGGVVPLDTLAAVVLVDYLQFRFGGAKWRPDTPGLGSLAAAMSARPAFAASAPT